mgnify:FL=1
MKAFYFIFVLAAMSIANTFAQVGINTTTPTATLEVVGSTKLDRSLFLENPDSNNQIRNSKLLIRTTGNEIIKYDIDISKYGPVNYSQFIFNNVSTNGLQDYDTKISTDDYIVSIQGYYFLEPITGDTDIMTHSNTDNNSIEGYQIYAYPNTTTNTWFLRAFINNGTFRTRFTSLPFSDTPIDLFLNLIIYRRGFITKEQSAITVDMANNETITAPLPPGF